MAAITASMVKELREMTGAGMMDCKKALTETDGNMEAAVDVLKKSGAVKMEKKASRIAAEGITRVASDANSAVVAEVNSETDFVAKNAVLHVIHADGNGREIHLALVQEEGDQLLVEDHREHGGKNGEDVQALLDGGLQAVTAEKTLQIGEKLSFRRFERVTGDIVTSYIHAGGKIGVLVSANGANNEASKEALTNIAMQIAAMSPQYVARNDISADEAAKLKDIVIDSSLNDPFTLPKPILQKLIDKAVADKAWSDADIAIYEEKKSNMNYLPNFLSEEAKASLAALAMENKSEYLSDKIFSGLVDGRISKHMKEICLLDQAYVKAEDGKQSVANYLASVSKDIVITKFVRFEVGEGMEKKNEDFAAEVAAQMGK